MSNWLRNFGAARESAFFKVEQARQGVLLCLPGRLPGTQHTET